jgi:hypothetical protein
LVAAHFVKWETRILEIAEHPDFGVADMHCINDNQSSCSDMEEQQHQATSTAMFHLNGSQGEQVTHAAAQRGARDEGPGKRQMMKVGSRERNLNIILCGRRFGEVALLLVVAGYFDTVVVAVVGCFSRDIMSNLFWREDGPAMRIMTQQKPNS